MNAMRRAAVIALCLGMAVVASAAPEFYAKAKQQGVGVVSASIPKTYGPGGFETKVAVCNLKEEALRGELKVVAGDKTLATAAIDLPPKQMSEAVQELVAKGTVEKEAKGSDIKVVIAVGGVETVCYAGKVGEKTEFAKPEKVDLPRFGAKPGKVRFVEAVKPSEGAEMRAFVEDGGILVVSPIKSQDDLNFCLAFVDKGSIPGFRAQKGKANAYDTRIYGGEFPLFDWPFAWSDTLEVGDNRLGGGRGWVSVQRDYTMAYRIGSGVLICSVLPLKEEKWLHENLQAHCDLESAGVRFRGTEHKYAQREEWMGGSGVPTVWGGSSSVSLKNVNVATTNLMMAFQVTVTAKDGQKRMSLGRGKCDKIGGDFGISAPFSSIDLSGECHVKCEILKWGEDWKYTVSEFDVTLPEAVEVVPPRYFGGVVSTCRKSPAIKAGVRVNRKYAKLEGKAWTLKALDKDGKEVAFATGTFGAGQREIQADLEIPKSAPAGEYTLVGTVDCCCMKGVEAKAKLRIVAPEPGQIIVDQDGYLLNEGKPYLPLGIYHCHTWNLEEKIDDTGLRAMDMGFNWMQMWEWDYRTHLSLDPVTLADACRGEINALSNETDRAAFIPKRIEENKKFRKQIKDAGMWICYECFGVWNDCIVEHPGPGAKYSFEQLERMPREIKEVGTDPDHLVRMYYMADEAGGNFYGSLSRATKIFHENDPGLHPTFNLGNMPAVMAGDYGGQDRYCRYYGGLGSLNTFIEETEALKAAYARYQLRPFMVPQAFGQSPEQSTETPEYVRAEAFAGLIHGASGIGFYCWSQTGDWKGTHRQGMKWNPPTAHAVKQIIKEIRVFEQALMVPGKTVELKSEDGNVHAILCGDETTGRFLVALNTYELPVETALPVPGLSDLKLEPLFGAPEPKKAGGFFGIGAKDAIALKLPGWGTAIWRVK